MSGCAVVQDSASSSEEEIKSEEEEEHELEPREMTLVRPLPMFCLSRYLTHCYLVVPCSLVVL